MDLGGLVEFIATVFAIGACATLLFISVLAWYGARDGATRFLRSLAMPCGCLSGIAAVVGVAAALTTFNFPLAGLVLGVLLGGAASYVMARSVAWPP